MNTNLKSSTLSQAQKPQISLRDFPQPLALVKSTNKLDRPTQQQQKAIARIYVEQAWIYFQAQNWQDAVVACKNALESDCNNADAYKILGNILKIKGKKAEALGVYAKALEINPNSAAIYANLGSFYAEQKNWHQALDYYQQAVILEPNLAGAYRSLAQVWEELGDTNQALECLCQAVNLEPDKLSFQEYFSFGEELYQQGKLREASIFYTRGVELNPRAETELAQLVKILEELEEWQQAVVYYHQLISLSNGNKGHDSSLTNDKPIRNLLSGAKTSKAKNAIPAYLNSALDKVASAAREAKSAQHSSQQSKQLAPTNLATAKLSDTAKLPPTSQSPKLLPEIKTDTTDQPAAIQQTNSAGSWNNLGSLYAQKQQWLKAISCYQEAVELDPKLSKSYHNLARVYSKIGKKEQALLCWYQVFTLEPNLAQPTEYFRLAKNLLQYKQVDKAIACLRRAIELKSDFHQAYLFLGKIYEKQGKIAKAKACYEKVAASKK